MSGRRTQNAERRTQDSGLWSLVAARFSFDRT